MARTRDVMVLAVTGGRERTAQQLRSLMDQAGLRLDRIIDTTGPLRIAEATAC